MHGETIKNNQTICPELNKDSSFYTLRRVSPTLRVFKTQTEVEETSTYSDMCRYVNT